MDDVGGVHVEQGPEGLVDHPPTVHVLEDAGPDHCVQVGLHEPEDKIDVLVVFGLYGAVQSDHVLVLTQALQEGHLPVGPLGVSRVMKGIENLLNGHHRLGPLVHGLVDHPIGTLAQSLQDVKLLEDVRLEFLGHQPLIVKLLQSSCLR